MEKYTFAFVDIETTGGSSERNRIIEIAIIRVEQGKVVDSLNTLINPERHISHEIQMITGINPAELQNAQTFDSVAERVEELLHGAIFVAHNARFDYGFIKQEFRRLGKEFRAKCLCTVKLSRALYPRYKRHDLSSIIERFDFACRNRHRAYDDAKVLFDFFNLVHTSFKVERLDDAIAAVLKSISKAPHIRPEVLDSLPETPGVYIFSNDVGEHIYIGKSINIRNRVLNHFSNDINDDKEMKLALQSAKVEYIETAGELGALLLESKMIKQFQPLYNRMLRRLKRLVLLRKTYNRQGYATVEKQILTVEEVGSMTDILGIFRSESQLRGTLELAVKNHELCHKLLGLEKGSGPCFYHQLEKCKGACIGDEAAESYNVRFDEAFDKRRVRVWPFQGPILIEEKKNDTDGHAYIVDQWCLVESFTYSDDGREEFIAGEKIFDYDAYKLLSRYILDPKNKRHIKILTAQEFQQLVTREEMEIVE